MIFTDTREYIKELEETGDAVVVNQEVDWGMEAPAIVRRARELGDEFKGPMVLFENIKDYSDRRMAGGYLSSYRKLAVALGLDPSSSIQDIQAHYLKKMDDPIIKPVTVDQKTAPCKQNILLGNDADLFTLPVPMMHDGNGGRYVGTWHAVVTKDPDDGELNFGMYRQMAIDGKTMTSLFSPGSGGGDVFFGKYEPKNEPCPFATVLGMDPTLEAATVAWTHLSEPDFAGQLRGAPVELVKCETSDIEVPAHAEIVIEGEILPNVLLEEGPFGEYTGFRTGARGHRPTFRVKAITHRNNPIFPFACLGMPTDEAGLMTAFVLNINILKLLQKEGVPFKDCYVFPETSRFMLAVSLKTNSSTLSSEVADLIFANSEFPKIVLVDDDVDVFDLKEVVHAMCTRYHPRRGTKFNEFPKRMRTMPYSSSQERDKGPTSQVLFDATFPYEWRREVERPYPLTFKTGFTREIQQRVLSNWNNYGFKD
jgi:4-hydroxy-3-polyprenylbenzoate decarboxylase